MKATTRHAAEAWNEFCRKQVNAAQWFHDASLPESSKRFIQALDLPIIHPWCLDQSSLSNDLVSLTNTTSNLNFQNYATVFQRPDAAPMGGFTSLKNDIHDGSTLDTLITYLYMYLPPLWAFIELWFRLLSYIVAPLGLLILIGGLLEEQMTRKAFVTIPLRPKAELTVKTKTPPPSTIKIRFLSTVAVMSVASSMVLMTDSQYIYEFGTNTDLHPGHYGLFLYVACLVLAVRFTFTIPQHCRYCRRFTRLALFLLAVLTLHLTVDWNTKQLVFGVPHEVNVQVPTGLYYNSENPMIQQIVQQWPVHKRTYSNLTPLNDTALAPTKWMYTGDARTGLPYFLNSWPDLDWKRVYLRVSDGEVLALEIAFPPYGHDVTKTMYMLLHGVNGGTSDNYIKDFAWRQINKGSTVVLMASRGLLDDTPIRNWNLFHGARISDAHEAASALRRALNTPTQLLAGVGYSMGAIVLNNYVAKSGGNCALDAAFSVSGALECRYEQNFSRPQRVWQPMIADYMRQHQHIPKFAQRIKERLGKDETIGMLRALHMVSLDLYMSVKYNGYRDLENFYEDMGALGDIPMEILRKPSAALSPQDVQQLQISKIANISIPLCVLHAFDDPISTWRTIVANDGVMHPESLVRLGKGNLVLLLTEKGGHIGWPVGMVPMRRRWEFMSEAAASFVESVAQAKLQTTLTAITD